MAALSLADCEAVDELEQGGENLNLLTLGVRQQSRSVRRLQDTGNKNGIREIPKVLPVALAVCIRLHLHSVP